MFISQSLKMIDLMLVHGVTSALATALRRYRLHHCAFWLLQIFDDVFKRRKEKRLEDVLTEILTGVQVRCACAPKASHWGNGQRLNDILAFNCLFTFRSFYLIFRSY